ncbi:DUF1990 family protein [Streptomyces niveus]
MNSPTYDKTADAACVYLIEPQASVKSARMSPTDPVGADTMMRTLIPMQRGMMRRMRNLTYYDVGITAKGGPVPPGFHKLQLRTPLGLDTYDRAAEALFTWKMHQATPFIRVPADTPRAAPGVQVSLRVGPLTAPCEVVWTVNETHRTGFAYGTLTGHPECGEEAFVLERRPDNTTDFVITAISRSSAWYAAALGPCGRLLQQAVALRYAKSLKNLSGTR